MSNWILEVAGIEHRRVWEDAQVIAAGKRLLELLPADCAAEKIEIGRNAQALALELAERARHEKVVVLATGDPLYYGIGGTLCGIVDPKHLRIHPGLTAFQLFFCELKQPWEKASLFSVHGKGGVLPWRRILRSELAVVYGDPSAPAGTLAARLLEHFPAAAERPAAIGADLGLPSAEIHTGTLREMAAIPAGPLSMLVLLPEPGAVPELPLGLADSTYRHQANLITHPEIRAIVLSKLKLRPGVLWDLGSGSGSVGLEAAGLCSGLTVYAVEKNAERIADIQANLEAEKLENFVICHGDIGDRMEDLPAPDSIFLGGGIAYLLRAFECLKPGGRLVATGILVSTAARLGSVLNECRSELLTVNVSRAAALGEHQMWKAENPITIAVFEKP
jgi:precorrin-6Y C5,15-methyltransferase (decarboxylating)